MRATHCSFKPARPPTVVPSLMRKPKPGDTVLIGDEGDEPPVGEDRAAAGGAELEDRGLRLQGSGQKLVKGCRWGPSPIGGDGHLVRACRAVGAVSRGSQPRTCGGTLSNAENVPRFPWEGYS